MTKMRKLYDLIKENGSWDNHEIKILEETEKEATELLYLERTYFDKLKPIGNTNRCILWDHEKEEAEAAKRAFFFNRWKKAQKQ